MDENQGPVSVGLDVNTIHQGDCLELLGKMKSESIDLVFADPPFNIGYEYDVYDDRRSADDYLEWCTEWMRELHRVLKKQGTFWLAIGDEFAAELKVMAQRDLGFCCRSWVIWYYTFGVNCKRAFSRSHTHLFHFVKDRKDYTFHADNPAARVPSARQLVYADPRANPKGRLPDNTWILRPQDAPDGAFATEHDTWYYPRVAGTFKEREGFHGCQMPEQVLGRIVRLCSNPGEVVFDPFAGSGTTMAVAKKLGRQWLGTELSKEYVTHINKRLGQAKIGGALDGTEDPLSSAPRTRQGKQRQDPLQDRLKPEALAEELLSIIRHELPETPLLALLLDPKSQKLLHKACRRHKVPGSSVEWNRALWHLAVGKATIRDVASPPQQSVRFSVGSLDAFAPAAEAALSIVQRETECRLQDILCHPERVAEFDEIAGSLAPDASDFELRWTAWVLLHQRHRQQKASSRVQQNGAVAKLPRAKSLSTFRPQASLDVGVFIIEGPKKQTLYVGETAELQTHLDRMQDAGWQRFRPQKIRWIREHQRSEQLKAHWVEQLNPLLNLPQGRELSAVAAS